jgi:rod shape-determining protein MreD
VIVQRVSVVALVLVTAAILQTSLLPFLALSGFRPDLLLLVTIAFALRDGSLTGMRVGFAGGILSDLLLNESPVGLTALVFVGIAYAVGVVRPFLAPDSWTAPMTLSVMGTLVGVAGYGLLSAVLAEDPIAMGLIVQASLVSAIYALLLAPIVYGLVRRLSEQFPLEQSGLA